MDTVEAQSIPNSAQVQNIIVQTVDNAAISECWFACFDVLSIFLPFNVFLHSKLACC